MTARAPLLARGLPVPIGPVAGHMARPFGQSALCALINRALAPRIQEGMLDFLDGRVIAIEATDLDLAWGFTLDRRHVRPCRDPADATIRADSIALLLLAAQRADADTLFFRRRLVVEGDTELGLHLKNVLDTLELEDLPPALAHVLDRAGRAAERWS